MTTTLAILLVLVTIYALTMRKLYKSAERNASKFYNKFENECKVTEELKAEINRLKYRVSEAMSDLSYLRRKQENENLLSTSM